MKPETLLSLKGKILCVAGPPASGKSTFCRDLEQHLNQEQLGFSARYFPEHVHQPLLEAYLETNESRQKYAFSFQFIMAQRRISTYREAVLFAQSGGVALVDGPLQTDMAFSLMNYKNGHIIEKDYQIYLSMLTEYDSLPKPDYLIYLDVKPVTAHRRLLHRNRKSEVGAYDESFYTQLREMNAIAFGSLPVSLIDYNHDDETMDNPNEGVSQPQTITKEYLYRVLERVMSGVDLQNGI